MEKQVKYTLGKTERLKSRKLIEGLFRQGKSFSNFPFRVIWMLSENNDVNLQAGFSVSAKSFKRAVDRNRIKRLMREGWRLQKNGLKEALEQNEFYNNQQLSVFIIYTGNELPAYDAVHEKIAVIIKRLLKLVNEKAPANT